VNAPRTLADITTPALVVDVAAMERNIARMAAFFAARRCKLRPHFKAHKCVEIARRQLAAGACIGLTCATVFEAEGASAVSDDILIANEIATKDKCRRAAALAGRVGVTVAIDSIAGLDQIAAAARDAGTTVALVIDVNVGQDRCGVSPGSDAVALAERAVAASGNMSAGRGTRLRGLMGYEGHAVGIPERAGREASVRTAMEQLASTARLFRARGLPADIVSAGGTGSYDISSSFEDVTEIQAGSYVLMDTEYAKLGLPFEHALTVLGTVISRPTAERCVADSGHKACTKDHGHPAVKDIEGASVLALNDEHATIALPSGCSVAVGDRIQLLPSHIDPTINLHDVIYAVDGDIVVGMWPVDARGYGNRAPVQNSR
jgi:D-serine deaminase-like pyridoxal phosphate-dependent protein